MTGAAGVQVRSVTKLAGHRIAAFADLTGNHDFLDGHRVITTTNIDTTSALPIFTSVGGDRNTYGRVSVGSEVAVLTNVSLGLTAASTFARSQGNLRQVNLTIKAAF